MRLAKLMAKTARQNQPSDCHEDFATGVISVFILLLISFLGFYLIKDRGSERPMATRYPSRVQM